MSMYTDNQTPINGVSTNTTSEPIDVSQRDQFGFQFICSGHTSGNGVFSVDASNDKTNWIVGISFQDATSTTPGTWVTSKTLNSNTSAGGFLPQNTWRFVRYVLAFTTDGVYTVVHQAQS